jgi:hypothetical protein
VRATGPDGLVDHLAVDDADAFLILDKDRTGLLDIFVRRGQGFVDGLDLVGMDRGLCDEAHADAALHLVIQAALVPDREVGTVDRCNPRVGAGCDEATSCVA